MKRMMRLGLVCLAIIAVLASCSLMDENARIDSFVSGLNSNNRASMGSNFNLQNDQGLVNDSNWWNNSSPFPTAYQQYSVINRSAVTDIGGGQKEISGTLDSSIGPHPIVFDFEKIGNDWLIVVLDYNGGGLVLNGASQPGGKTDRVYLH